MQLTTETKQFFLTLARTTTGDASRYLQQLVTGTPAQVRVADSVVSRDPLLHAIMRNTFAPVIMSGGFRANVIPGIGRGHLNLRLIPGTDPPAMVKLLEQIINDPRVTVKLARRGRGRPANRDGWCSAHRTVRVAGRDGALSGAGA